MREVPLLAPGLAARRSTACAARAAETGTSLDRARLDTAADKLRHKWERAVARGDCPLAASAVDAQAAIDSFLAAVMGLVLPATHCCDTGAACGSIVDAPTCASARGTYHASALCDGAGACVPF